MKKLFVILILLCAGGGAAYYATHGSTDGSATRLRTEEIGRGDLIMTVNATGTLEPEEVVNVGAQVAGLIVSFGDDPETPSKHVDYCSVVEKDSVLAEIDPTFHAANLEQAEALLQSAQARVQQSEARLKKATSEWKRIESLLPTKAVSQSDFETAVADYEAAKADVAAGKAGVRQSEASVKTAKINLGYCTIKSPVRGTIIERRVNIGQTVVASLNAPSLFLIAKDLSKMEVWTSVNEADIGRIRLKMPVWFTVDAHEGETFRGEVTQIRMNAQMTQNVVTYTVVVTTDNSSGKLLPYLTANVRFEIEKHPHVLIVPNVALRWMPEAAQLDPTVDPSILADASDGPKSRDAAPEKSESTVKTPLHAKGRIWSLTAEGRVKPLEVTIGATDGTGSEISGDGVAEGLLVVTGEESAKAGSAAGDQPSSPFLPKMPTRGRRPPGPPG